MSTTGAHVRNRHQVGPDGLAATRDTHGPPGFSPAVQGVSYADQRSGEQSQLGDLAPGSVDGSIIAPGGVDGGVHILPATLSMDLFAEGIIPPRVVDELPVLPDTDYPQGSMVLLTTDGKLYRTPTGTAWTAEVDGNDILAGSIVAGKVAAGAIGTTELAAGSITTEKFHVGAKAPNVENSTAEVLIDSTGITILNGKITLLDYAGQTALTAAGFGGAWIDFMASRVYNGHFDAGALSSGLTAVGAGATYEDKLSEDVPYWVVEQISGAECSYGIVDDPTYARALRSTFTGDTGQYIDFYQDIPISAQASYAIEVWDDLAVSATVLPSTYGVYLQLYRSYLDSDRNIIGTEAFVAQDYTTSLSAQLGKIYSTYLDTPARAKYVRLKARMLFNQAGDGTDVVATVSLLQVKIAALDVVPKLTLGTWTVLSTRGLHEITRVDSGGGTLQIESGNGVSIRSVMTDATGSPTLVVENAATGFEAVKAYDSGKVVLESPSGSRARFEMYEDTHGFAGVEILGADASNPGQIALGPGSGAVDVHLSRGAANRLDLASGDSFNIVNGSLHMSGKKVTFADTPPSSPSDDDLWYNTGTAQWGNEWFFYKSSIGRWITVAPRLHTLHPDQLNPFGANTNQWGASELPWGDIFVDAFMWTFYINGGTNNAGNHWTFRGYISGGVGYTQIGATQTTLGQPTTQWVRGYMSIQAVYTAALIQSFRFECGRVGAPSGLYCPVLLKYRLCYT